MNLKSTTGNNSRSVKFAVAIIITLENKNETLYDFIFTHFALIENRLHQLQAIAFKQLKNHPLQLRKIAFQNDPLFIDASNQFKKSFFDLYSTRRIQVSLLFFL